MENIHTKRSGKKLVQSLWKKKTYDHKITMCGKTNCKKPEKTYKSVKDHNNQSGNDRRIWQFYEVKLNYKYSKKVHSTFLHCLDISFFYFLFFTFLFFYFICRLWIKSLFKKSLVLSNCCCIEGTFY